MILTATGLVAIENIRAGDIVISTNPDTMETAGKRVVETYVRTDTKLIHLVVNGEEIITTETHPFYVNKRGFINAGELKVGDELVDVNNNILLIEDYKVELPEKPTTVYNFQVEDFHTYHVGSFGILVHNAGNGYRTKTVKVAKGDEEIPIVGKPGSPSWKQAVKDLRSAKGKGKNYIVDNQKYAEHLINEAKPNLSKVSAYNSTAPKSNYQIHPIDNEYNMPHIKFQDWVNGKKNGTSGHIFWE